MSASLVNWTFAAYVASFLLWGVQLVLGGSKWTRLLKIAAFGVFLLAFLANTATIGFRWLEAGHPPFSNMYESLLCFAWCLGVAYLILECAYRPPFLGFGSALLIVFMFTSASFLDSEVRPLVPALRSNWLVFHVVLCFVSYAAFAVSFVTAVLYLFLRRRSRSSQALPTMHRASYLSVSFGFLFLTLGIVTGSIWAERAWGSYWSWDPKETWALITWFGYGAYLHCRSVKGWGKGRLAWMAMAGFLVVLFTYVGVNYLLPGLHSYT